MKQTPIYDTFISHSREDADQVEYLAMKLKNEARFKVWFDKWELIAGKSFSDGMAKGLKASKTCVVIIGSKTQKGWFKKEVDSALDRQAGDPSFSVISVILPEAKPAFVSDFLKSLTWVKFDDNLDEERPFHELVCGIKNIPPGQKYLKSAASKKTPNLQPTDGFPKELTLNFPKLRLDQVIGRVTEIEDLRKRLFDNKQVVLVNGMGGIGKTTVAEVYVTQNLGYYKHIVWVNQLTDDFSNDLINSRGLLNNLKIEKEDKSLEQLFDELLLGLKNIPEEPCLMVIDNATTKLSKFYNLLPGQPKWHILVTSRERIPNFDIKEIGFLSEPDAVALFKKHYNKKTIGDPAIKEIVESIDYHTLTIEILSRTAQEQRKSPESILKAIQNDLPADVKVRHSMDKIEKVTSYLCSIFDLSSLDENEKWLLSNFACLPPEFHTYEQLNDLIQPDEERMDVFSQLLSKLANNGWLLFNDVADSYKLHRILSDVIGKSIPVEINTVESLISNISKKLSLDHTKDNPIDKFKWIPYGKAILIHFNTDSSYSIFILQNNLALRHKDLGDYVGAKELLEKVVTSAEKNLGPEHTSTASVYSNLATVLRVLGDYNGAKKLLEKALVSDEKNFEPNHPTIGIRYSNLALVYQDLGDYPGGKELLEKALASAEKNFGPDHPTTVIRYSNLATVLHDMEDYHGARKLLEKAVASDEKNFGPDHPATASSYSNLALVLRDLGDHHGAKKLLEKAMASGEKNFGPEHPKMAIRYSNLASVLQDLGDYDGAKDWLEKAIVLDEKNFGFENPSTAISYSNLAGVLQNMGDYDEAKQLLEKAIISADKNLGPGHPTTISRRKRMQNLIKKMNNF